MINVYFYVPNECAQEVAECGLSMLRWSDKNGYILGGIRNCMTAYLDPKDALDQYDSNELTCLRLQVSPVYCRVADARLYEVGLSNPVIMDLFWKTLSPISNYAFGTFFQPIALITSTVMPEHLFVTDRKREMPRLVESNENLYINNLIDRLETEQPDIKNRLLYAYFKALSQNYGYSEHISADEKSVVFVNLLGAHVTLNMPERFAMEASELELSQSEC